jgi:hypothetical protein
MPRNGLCCSTSPANDTYAAPRLAEIRVGLNETYFAWSGPITHAPDRNGASYFKMQGPKLFIEFAPQQPGGSDPARAYDLPRPDQRLGREFVEKMVPAVTKT